MVEYQVSADLVGVYGVLKSLGEHLGQRDGDTEGDDGDDKGIDYCGPNVLSNGNSDVGGTAMVGGGGGGVEGEWCSGAWFVCVCAHVCGVCWWLFEGGVYTRKYGNPQYAEGVWA